MEKNLLKASDVARRLGVSMVTIHNWIRAGKIRAVLLNKTKKRKTVRIEESEVERIITEGKKNNLERNVNKYLRRIGVIR